MKILKRLVCLFFLFLTVNAYGQTGGELANWEKGLLANEELDKREIKSEILKYDFSPLWTKTENSMVFGFIGNEYQRLRMKIISVSKDRRSPDTYNVVGKSMVKNNISEFRGTIRITKARAYRNISSGLDDEYKDKGVKRQGFIIAKYLFAEDKAQPYSGTFEGLLWTAWYIDKNGIKYDDIETYSDSYLNNQFAGTWKSYKTGLVKTANWGDYRIPLSGDLDIGAGEFSPDEKYLKFGWQTYRDAYAGDDKKARLEEEREWWK